VAERCARSNKRFQAMGSAKNHLVVMPDAKIDDVVRNMITSCYGCAGQRCMAASAIVCVGDETYKTVCAKYVEASKKVVVGNPLDPAVAEEPIVVGPVISAEAKKKILRFGGMKSSQFADIKTQGKAVINFFTEDKITTERYFTKE
jgi:malonate-semialdehyde dehydrogenase (acetylating)/methylmalonate-semialdehyde dehydrogenase